MEAVIEVFGRSNRLESKRIRSQANVQIDRKKDTITLSIRTNTTHDIYISKNIQPSVIGNDKGIKVYIPEYRTYIHLSAVENQGVDETYSLLSSSLSASSTSTEKENTSPNIGQKVGAPKQTVSKTSMSALTGFKRPQGTLSTLIKTTSSSSASFMSPKKPILKLPHDGIKRSPPKSRFLTSPEGGSTSMWARLPGLKKGKYGSPSDKFKIPTSDNTNNGKIAVLDTFRVASERCTPPKPAVPKFSVSQRDSKIGTTHHTQTSAPSLLVSPTARRSPGRSPYKITDEQELVLKACCQDSHNIFFSGSAGTGKSSLLKVIIEALRSKYGANSVFVTATTGLAACAIEGITVHQFAGISVAHESESGAISQIASKVSINHICLNTLK